MRSERFGSEVRAQGQRAMRMATKRAKTDRPKFWDFRFVGMRNPLLLLLACLLSACSKQSDGWHIGQWEFDPEFTLQKQAEKPREADLVGATKSMVTNQLNTQMEGAKVTFTAHQLTMTTKDGNGKSYTYMKVANDDPNAVSLKTLDGEVHTIHREGDRFWMNSTGNVNEPFYFKRRQ
jgi:hypothetical protein